MSENDLHRLGDNRPVQKHRLILDSLSIVPAYEYNEENPQQHGGNHKNKTGNQRQSNPRG